MHAPDSWQPAQVLSLRDLSPSVREFLIAPEGGPQPYAPGAHIEVEIAAKEAGLAANPSGTEVCSAPRATGVRSASSPTHVRSYSLVGASRPDGYRIAVKRLDAGRGGSSAMWALQPGDTLHVNGPLNHFSLGWSAPAYLLLAGGIGVTPLLGMAQALIQRGLPAQMVYGVRDAAELVLADELRAVLGERLRTVVGERLDFAALYSGLPPGAQVYLCGPQAMMQAAMAAWAQAGRPAQDLRLETFGNAGGQASGAFTVHLPRHGLSLEVPQTSSLLETLERHGIAALSNCRKGECGLCALDVLGFDGELEHRDVYLSADEKKANQRICACVSRARGSVTLDTAWRPEPR